APKKGGGCLIWGWLGGAAAAFFGLIVAGVAVWFFFLRGDGERPLTGPGSTLDPVAIKFFVPHKKGDRREGKVVMEQQTEVKNEGANLPGNPGMGGVKTRQTGNVERVVRTTEVNDKGEETKVELTIDSFSLSNEGGGPNNKAITTTLPKGTVLVGQKGQFMWDWKNSRGQLPDVLAVGGVNQMMQTSHMGLEGEASMDRFFGTDKKQSVGDTWPINKDEILRESREKREQALKGAKFGNVQLPEPQE